MKRENLLKNFKDIPELFPSTIKQILRGENGQRDFDVKVERVRRATKDGLTTTEAVALAFGVTILTVKKWKKAVEKEMLDGKTDTPLLAIFTAGIKSELELYNKVARIRTRKILEEEDHGFIRDYMKEYRGEKSKHEVELSSDEHKPVTINYQEMKDEPED